jgi:hypothetical protein
MSTILFLVIIYVELSAMSPKNRKIGELELKEQAKKKASERFSKLVTLFFLVAQFWSTFISFAVMCVTFTPI